MMTILIWALVLGLIALVIYHMPIPHPFKTIAYCVLGVVLILVLVSLLPGGPVVVPAR